jgi:hypothetical protein
MVGRARARGGETRKDLAVAAAIGLRLHADIPDL